MRFEIQQGRDEQHHEQFRIELGIREERQVGDQHAQHDLHQRRGYTRYETTGERAHHHCCDNAQDELEYSHECLPFFITQSI